MTKSVHGTVHGSTIHLENDLGLADGQEVEVWVEVSVKPAGDGILKSAGILADDPYWDGIMEEIYQARKQDTGRKIPE